MSVDGFMAGPGGDMSWLTEYLGPNPMVDELISQIGSLLVGRNTFGGDDPHRGDPDKEGKAFGGGWSGPSFVLTHNPPTTSSPDVSFVDDLAGGVAAARAAAGGKYVNVLGANVARQMIDQGLLDEVLVLIAPVMLGAGVRLFDYPGGRTVRLERISFTQAPLASVIWFRVLR
jgi:dihydrofolate reductase